MCIQNKICCAPSGKGRCPNNTVSVGSNHCSIHHDEAVESYCNYKKICKIAESKDIFTEIKDTRKYLRHLYECHKILVEAYNARLNYAEKFYVIECQDNGHDKQYQIIMSKINHCRLKSKELKKKLESETQPVKVKCVIPKISIGQRPNFLKLLEEEESCEQGAFAEEEEGNSHKEKSTIAEEEGNSHKEKSTIAEEGNPLKEENGMIEEIDRFEKKQKEDDSAFNRQLSADKKKNKKLADEKKKIAVLAKKLISKELTPEFDIYFLQLSFLNIMVQFHNIDYFEDDYEPEMCDKCSCGGYIPKQFKLGCSCFLEKDGECVDFLCKSQIATENLSDMCYLILTEKDKIAPMVKELINHYRTHGAKMVNRIMTLTWDPELDRLVLTCETVKNYHKPSVYMAETRKRRQLGKNKIITRERDISPDTRWGHILDELSDYVSRNGKLPPANSKNPSIVFLHNWLWKQLKDYEKDKGLLANEQNREHLEKFVGKYPRFFRFE